MTRPFIFASTLVALVVAGCAAPTPTPDSIATAVAATVAAYPTRVPISTVVQVSTVIQVATVIQVLPSDTPEPLPTGQPSSTSTPAPTDTAVPTITVTPSTSPTASLTPPPSLTAAADPKAGLGVPTFQDTFTNTGGYLTWSDETSSGKVENGQYVLTVLRGGTYQQSLRNLQGADFYIELTARVGSCAPGDAYGLLYRGQSDRSSGYFFAVSCDGSYRLFKLVSGNASAVPIVDWTRANAIVRGPNATNVLGLYGNGSQIALYANGKLLRTTTDTAFADGVFTGLYARAATASFSVSFDDLTIWNLND